MISLIAIVLSIYLIACLLLYKIQAKFIFFPSRDIDLKPLELGMNYQDIWLPVTTEKKAEIKIHGWWIPAASSNKINKVLLYLHGNGCNISANLRHANRFHQLGLDVLIIDYCGYGLSTDIFPNEKQIYRDVATAWDYLVNQRGIDSKSILIYGHSLGGAIAIDLAVKYPYMTGLIIEGSFTSIREMVNYRNRLYRIFPINFLLHQKFDSINKIAKLTMPILFIHGTEDEVIPLTVGQKLFAAKQGPKQLYLVPGAGHNNLATIAGAEYLEKVASFVNSF